MRNGTTTIASALSAWADCDWTEGVQIDGLRELDSLSVRTCNSRYEIVVTSPSSCNVLVRGGTRFPDFTPARVCGSTAGGSILKQSGIYPGLRLEFEQGGRRIVTSTVVAVTIDPDSRAQ
jgi:hypothetical protein